MFTISIKLLNDYISQQYTEPTTVKTIKDNILNEKSGFYYENLVLLNYHNEIMNDNYPITETTVLKLIIKPIKCSHHH